MEKILLLSIYEIKYSQWTQLLRLTEKGARLGKEEAAKEKRLLEYLGQHAEENIRFLFIQCQGRKSHGDLSRFVIRVLENSSLYKKYRERVHSARTPDEKSDLWRKVLRGLRTQEKQRERDARDKRR